MNKFKLISLIILIGCVQYKSNVNAKRISELKCDKITSLVTDSRSKYPHLMEFFDEEFKSQSCTGSLISEDFVLTSGVCVDFLQDRMSHMIARKIIFSDEQYSNSKAFSFKRLILHPLFKTGITNKNYDIGLIQLNETVFNHGNTSIFRPACVWSDIHQPIIDTYELYTNNNQLDEYVVESFTTSVNCNNTIAKFNSTMFICFDTSDSFIEDGSPATHKIENRNYIFGIFSLTWSDGDSQNLAVLKINHLIEWIESTVWPVIQEDLPSQQCGERKIKHKPYMTWAKPTYNGEFPWHIALYLDNQTYICGGTIISSLTILTAAHCVHDERGVVSSYRFNILAGTHSLTEYSIDARNYVVRNVIVHENYNRHFLENDIALLKLKWLIEFSNYIQPICLSNILDYSNITMGSVAGWGLTENDRQSKVLLQATLPIVDEFTCRESNREFFSNYLNSHNYCAGYDNGTNVCSGDSGGAMIIKQNSRWYIRGTVSLGVALENSDQCDVTQLVIFTNIPKFYNWIIEKIEDDNKI